MTEQDVITLIDDLIAEPREQSWLEYKTNVSEQGASVTPEGIGEYISGLANGACISNKDFGYLILGIEDSTRQVIGSNFRPSESTYGNQDFELWLRMLVNPKLGFAIFECTYKNKQVVLFRIPSAKGEPVTFKHKAYIRINSQKTSLHNFPDYVRQIYNYQEDWSAKTIDTASIKNLDETALTEAHRKFKNKSINEKFYNEIDAWDTATFLDKAKITVNGKISNTAILLLGKPESSHFLSPSVAEITWKLDTDQKAYEHFDIPFLLNTTEVLRRIRNYQYKFFPDNELLAVSVNKYETRVILEALHNAIAHQDYSKNSRIIVTEKVDKLIFQNSGGFYSGSPEEYFLGTKTPDRYRNQWLAKAMVNLGMIDTVGYGIYTMLVEQKNRFFPLPDFSDSNFDKVILQIYGREIDVNYSKLLIENKNIDLKTVILLDKVQKNLPITKEDAGYLKKQRLIEGRNPNYFVSVSVSGIIEKKAAYSKNKAFNKSYYLDLIIKAITEHNVLERKEVDELLWEKLPDWMSDVQKRNKIKNLLNELSKKSRKIKNDGTNTRPKWHLI